MNTGKSLITNERNRLADDVIDAIECLKSWWKAGPIDEAKLEGVEIIMKDLAERDQIQKAQSSYSSSVRQSLMTGFE